MLSFIVINVWQTYNLLFRNMIYHEHASIEINGWCGFTTVEARATVCTDDGMMRACGSTLKNNMVPCNLVQWSAVQYSEVQCGTVQYSAV